MCGIFLCATKSSQEDTNNQTIPDKLWHSLLQRGPDCHSVVSVESHSEWKFLFGGTVLWMQGDEPSNQPIMDKNKNVLLWNGDIFHGPLVPKGNSSDSASLLEFLHMSKDDDSALQVLSSVRGPFTFVYWNSASQKLWFGRDRLGRHSLLWHIKDREQLTLSSVGEKRTAFEEVPAIGIFMINFSENGIDNVVVFPWTDIDEDSVAQVQTNSVVPFNMSSNRIQSPINLYKALNFNEPSEEYLTIINQCKDRTEPCNVFRNLLSCDYITTRVEELICKLKQSVKVRCRTQPGKCSNCLSVKCQHSELIPSTPSHASVNIIRTEVCACCSECKNLCVQKETVSCRHPKIGVLFSGGLDSTVLAAVASEFIPLEEPIDLFNVAFECVRSKTQQMKVRKGREQCPAPTVDFNVPDRQTGLQSYEELKRLFPDRQWNFVEIDIGKAELEQYRSERIRDLIHPLNTVLDDSLGCALWFASRKQGSVNGEMYKSPVRVLLLGMGADEQLGGYSRHRNLLHASGWQALSDGLWLDLARISSRNMGRDDRVVSSHGCQGRFPFLDEEVVSYLFSLPAWERCYPTPDFPPGIGDKLLLRLVAWRLGLQKAATFPKRAFQFGSRIANSKEKGSDVSTRL